jgi:hypothetical protein
MQKLDKPKVRNLIEKSGSGGKKNRWEIEEKRVELQPSVLRCKIGQNIWEIGAKQAKKTAEDDLYNELENEPTKTYKLAKT